MFKLSFTRERQPVKKLQAPGAFKSLANGIRALPHWADKIVSGYGFVRAFNGDRPRRKAIRAARSSSRKVVATGGWSRPRPGWAIAVKARGRRRSPPMRWRATIARIWHQHTAVSSNKNRRSHARAAVNAVFDHHARQCAARTTDARLLFTKRLLFAFSVRGVVRARVASCRCHTTSGHKARQTANRQTRQHRQGHKNSSKDYHRVIVALAKEDGRGFWSCVRLARGWLRLCRGECCRCHGWFSGQATVGRALRYRAAAPHTILFARVRRIKGPNPAGIGRNLKRLVEIKRRASARCHHSSWWPEVIVKVAQLPPGWRLLARTPPHVISQNATSHRANDTTLTIAKVYSFHSLDRRHWHGRLVNGIRVHAIAEDDHAVSVPRARGLHRGRQQHGSTVVAGRR